MREIVTKPVVLSTSHTGSAVPEIEHRLAAAEAAAGLVLVDTSGMAISTAPAEMHRRRLKRLKQVVTGAAGEMKDLQRGGRRWRAALLTLTYRPGVEWQPRHISELRNHIRGWLGRRKCNYHCVWVMELQKRGAPHYHLIIWLPSGLTLPKPDKQGWWPHGMTNIQWARKPVAYLSKYASKGGDTPHRLPAGARLYGVAGCPSHLGWWRAPTWLQAIGDPRMRIRRLRRGWWAIDNRAVAIRSPYRVVGFGAGCVQIDWVGWRSGDMQPLYVVEQWLDG